MSRRNPLDEINLTEQHNLFIKQFLQECKKTELYQAVLKKKLPDEADLLKSIHFPIWNHQKRSVHGVELPEITDRSIPFFLAYEGNHDDILEFLLAQFPNLLGEAIQGYAEAGHHSKVQFWLARYPRSSLIFSAMYGYAESYRILHLAKLVTLSALKQYFIEPECEIFLKSSIPQDYKRYSSKYLLIKKNPSHFYYVNSTGELQAVSIPNPARFLQEFAYYQDQSSKWTEKTNPIALTRRQTEEFINSIRSHALAETYMAIINGLHPECALKDPLQNDALVKLLAYINGDEGRNHILATLKKRFREQEKEKRFNDILSEAVEMRTVLLGVCQCMGLLSALFPKELIYLIVCYSAAIKQEECEPLFSHLTATVQPALASNIQNLLSWFPCCPLAPAPIPSSGCTIC